MCNHLICFRLIIDLRLLNVPLSFKSSANTTLGPSRTSPGFITGMLAFLTASVSPASPANSSRNVASFSSWAGLRSLSEDAVACTCSNSMHSETFFSRSLRFRNASLFSAGSTAACTSEGCDSCHMCLRFFPFPAPPLPLLFPAFPDSWVHPGMGLATPFTNVSHMFRAATLI